MKFSELNENIQNHATKSFANIRGRLKYITHTGASRVARPSAAAAAAALGPPAALSPVRFSSRFFFTFDLYFPSFSIETRVVGIRHGVRAVQSDGQIAE